MKTLSPFSTEIPSAQKLPLPKPLFVYRYQLPLLRLREPSRHGRVRGHGQPGWISGCGLAELYRLAHRYGGEGG